jgi:hypothetical protein
MTDDTPLPQGWVDEQIEGFRIMLDRDVSLRFPFTIITVSTFQISLLSPPHTAKNERKDACKARVFGQQAIVVVCPGHGPEQESQS